ncbi:methanogen output domain 1-containing protein [Parvularcula sp. LCG005]|uniref:methanogen output domain 1-containing protein n=1 Tax=Parvularcula sp. LCG005 TaxID=3078805 RepID=UPI002942B381|nr:methanogen output domain 1-containing protein [Parvularcula sp. LCG005]WOI54708.1 methanogen output domain 1-containing protein [Parvularcula sp. LCG005]
MENQINQNIERFADIVVNHDREEFLATLVGKLAGTLQDFIGIEESKGFLTLVGAEVGEKMSDDYRTALDVSRLDSGQIAAALVDLQTRINGAFEVVDIDQRRIILRNGRCPFMEHGARRDSLCQITSSVFGRLTADNNGYAKVVLNRTIAAGDGHCEVVIFLDDSDPRAIQYGDQGDEYFEDLTKLPEELAS